MIAVGREHSKNTNSVEARHPGPEGESVVRQRSVTTFHIPVWAQNIPMQANLTVNQPGDAYEQEAERVAAQVMRMPDAPAAPLQRCACGGIIAETGECPACRLAQQGLHRQGDAAGGMQAPQSVHETLRAPGVSLDASTRGFMEARFGYDFNGVRVHTNDEAAQSARAVNAHSYTVGKNIAFAEGRYAPGTQAGMTLIAHELAHVVQQNGATSQLARDDVSNPDATKAGETKPADKLANKPADKPEEKKAELGFGSYAWPVLVLDPILFKLPQRWRSAVGGWKPGQDEVLFDPSLGRKLVYSQFQSLINLAYAGLYTQTSPYKPDFGKALSQAEALSGVSDTYLNLISLALRYDLKKYLEKDLPDVAIANLGWVIIYGLLLQGGLVGLNAALESDLDFTTLIKPAVKTFTDAPLGFSRPYTLGNTYDPRWSSPFLTAPSGLESKLTGYGDAAKPYTFNLNLGVNVASIADLYPKDEKEKEKYKGLELFPYLSLSHSWAKEGQLDPELRTRWLAGAFVGGEGFYTLIEGGQRIGADGKVAETYAREGLFLRALGPLSLLQLSSEQSLRPDPVGLRSRLNAATTIRILDNDTWKLTVGGTVGGVLPKGGAPGAYDVGGQVAFYHERKPALGGDPLRTGFDVGATYRPQDPFAPDSARLFSLKTNVSLLDYVRLGLEYHRITGSNLDLNLPTADVRFMVFFGTGIFSGIQDKK